MEIFKDGHMTRAAQKIDQLLAQQDSYWAAHNTEYGYSDQEAPGKAFVVNYLPPGLVQIELNPTTEKAPLETCHQEVA